MRVLSKGLRDSAFKQLSPVGLDTPNKSAALRSDNSPFSHRWRTASNSGGLAIVFLPNYTPPTEKVDHSGRWIYDERGTADNQGICCTYNLQSLLHDIIIKTFFIEDYARTEPTIQLLVIYTISAGMSTESPTPLTCPRHRKTPPVCCL